MWTSVYMTQSIENARTIRLKIENREIPVMLHCIRVEDKSGEDCYELLVPRAELCDALEIIIGE